MTYDFRLPDVGEGIAEAEIVRWLVHEGETVTLDQPIVEIQTDKAIVEVPAPVDGVIGRLGGRVGDILQVGELLVRLETAPGDRQAPLRTLGRSAAAERHAPADPPPASKRPLATPAVRKLARELAVDLAAVAGNGPGGRVTADDLRAVASRATRPAAQSALGTAAAALAPDDPHPRELRSGAPPDSVLSPQSSVLRVPLRGLRRRIAETMAESWRTIPHISGHDEVDVSALVALRARMQPAAEAGGVHLTYLPFVLKAAVTALKRYPIANAFLDQAAGEIVYHSRYNIGIATATPDGLIVPVIHDADQKSLRELQTEIAELREQARSRRIGLTALKGGSFTITNFGSLGGWIGTPIIRPGEAAILGVGRIDQRAWVVDGRIEARPVMALSLSADHRLIDGDVSTGFLGAVAGYLTDPLSLFLELT